MGRTSAQSYGIGMERRRLGDRLGGLALFVFNPLVWLIDITLQKIWPLSEPRPPDGATLPQKLKFELRLFVKDLALVLAFLIPVMLVAFTLAAW
jgi:hypothetical protein